MSNAGLPRGFSRPEVGRMLRKRCGDGQESRMQPEQGTAQTSSMATGMRLCESERD